MEPSVKRDATVQPAARGLAHALVDPDTGERSGCRWGIVCITDHDSWWGPVV